MKALKEKRNSFRSLWRMGLVILGVFALVLVACGDSNTADPYLPISPGSPSTNGPNQQTSGGGTNGVEKAIISMNIRTQPINHSQEGKNPDLTGIVVEAWYNDGGMELIRDPSVFGTIPAIVGQEQLASYVLKGAPDADDSLFHGKAGSGEDDTLAVDTHIAIYHKRYSGPQAVAILPGVQALAARLDDPKLEGGQADRGYSQVKIGETVVVVGNSGVGVNYIGDWREVPLYEDGSLDDLVKLFKQIKVIVKYQPLYGGNAPDTVYVPDPTDPDDTVEKFLEDNGHKINAVGASVAWEVLELNQDHVFLDYTTNFDKYEDPITHLELTANDKVPYAYGIDPNPNPEGKLLVNILISKGAKSQRRNHGGKTFTQQGTGYQALNSSIYIAVPYKEYLYVRDVEAEVTWETPDRPFLLPTADLFDWTKDDWTEYLIDHDIKLTVSYWDTPETKSKDAFDFRRSVELRRAGVYNEPMWRVTAAGNKTVHKVYGDDEDYGWVVVGYYASLFDPYSRSPLEWGDFANADVLEAPIAQFVEGSGKLDFQTAAYPKKDAYFISPQGSRPSAMTDAQLENLRNTYDFFGDFIYEGTTVTEVIIPGKDFQKNFWSPQVFWVRSEAEETEVTFTVPRNVETRYQDYVGEEDTKSFMVYPFSYDNK